MNPTPPSPVASGGFCRVRLWRIVAAAALLVSFTDRELCAQEPTTGDDAATARERAQAFFQDDKPRQAVAILSEAGRKHPRDRVLGAMLYASIRDHVWHVPQILPLRHGGAVRALAFSGDGKQLASGSATGEIWISTTEAHDAEEALAARIVLPNAESEIVGLWFSKDGTRLAAVSKVEGLRVWDVAAKKTVFEAPRPAQPITAFAKGPLRDLFAFGTAEGMIAVADLGAGKIVAEFQQPGGPVGALAFSRSAQKLVAACHGGLTRVWNLETGKPIGEGIRQTGSVLSVDFAVEDGYVVTAGDDKNIHYWSVEEGVRAIPSMDCKTTVLKARVSPDGSRIAAMLDDGSVKFWDALTGKELPFDVREDGQFNDVIWSRTGLRMATASEGGHATVWSARDGTRWGELLPHEAPVLALAYSADGKLLATGCGDGQARVWRMDGGKAMPTVRSHSARARTAFYSLDGEHLVTASEDHTALHWISGQVRPVGRALKHRGKVTCGTFDKDVTRILTSDDTGVAQLWNVETSQADGPPFRHKSAVNWVDFHPDGKRFVTASGAGASVWSVDQRNKPLAVIVHASRGRSELKCARFSPDGKWLATASTDGTARIWDATTYKPTTEPIRRGFPVLCVRFSPDSSRLVIAGEDAQAVIYDTATWKPVGRPILFPGPVFSAAITADNLFLVASSFLLNAVQFFEIETGRPLGDGLAVPSQTTCVDYHLPDKVVIVACDDGTVRAFGSPFVNRDIPPWACDFAERLVGYRQTGPDDFERVNSHRSQLANYVSRAARATNADFPRLVTWKMTMGSQRTGMPRFVSTIAANIERRVEERSIDALYECYEAAPGDALVLAALSAYLPAGRQSEFLADVVVARQDAEPLPLAFAAATLINAGRVEEAQKVMAKAAAAAPNDPRVLRREAKFNARLMNKDLAIEQFEKTLALEPNDFETQRAYAWALYNLDEPRKAAAQFRLAQDLTGDLNPDLVAGLCLCAAAVRNTSEATAAFRRLVALDPVWKEAAYIASLPGWTQRELRSLESVRSTLFPVRR